MKKIYLLSILLLGFISCNTHNVVDSPAIELENQALFFPSKLDMQSAAEQAIQIRSLLSNSSPTRSAENISVLDVKPITEVATRNDTSVIDTLVYVVNFEDDKGYVVLNSDQTVLPILSFSEQGNLNIDSISNIPTAAFIYQSIRDTVVTARTNRPIVDTLSGDYFDPDDLMTLYFNWTLDTEVEPLVPVQWDQYEPFNSKLDSIDEQLPPIGCVATAALQIMAAHRKPTMYDWTQMIPYPESDYAEDIAGTLARDFGERIGMKYSLGGSSVSSAKVPATLRTFGYHSDEIENYSNEALMSELVDRRAVYLSGQNCPLGYTQNDDLSNGVKPAAHAWVCDGYMKFKRMVAVVYKENLEPFEVYNETKTYVHYNIGWGETCYNAYYILGTFNIDNFYREPDEADDENHSTEASFVIPQSDAYNYKYYVQLIKDIY